MATAWTAFAIEAGVVFVIAASLAGWARRGFPVRLAGRGRRISK